jgi:hypothetical protein
LLVQSLVLYQQAQFKCNGQLTLLAYEYDPATRLLLLLGAHENFGLDWNDKRMFPCVQP